MKESTAVLGRMEELSNDIAYLVNLKRLKPLTKKELADVDIKLEELKKKQQFYINEAKKH
jgi:hypothetical protein